VRRSRAKMEINKETPFNPIKQDTKNGKLRSYGVDSLVNYGAMPQTWEDPAHVMPGTSVGGDNDPLDVVELSAKPCTTGEVYLVRVLGVLALVDGDEMDWKVVTIRAEDASMDSVTDAAHVEDAGVQRKLEDVREWFRVYKTYEGKGENEFAFGGQFLSRDKAIEVIHAQHHMWRALVGRARTADDAIWWKQQSPQ